MEFIKMSNEPISGCLGVALLVCLAGLIIAIRWALHYKERFRQEVRENRQIVIDDQNLINELTSQRDQLRKNIDAASDMESAVPGQKEERVRRLAVLLDELQALRKKDRETWPGIVEEIRGLLREHVEKYCKLYNEHEWFMTLVHLSFPEQYQELIRSPRVQLDVAALKEMKELPARSGVVNDE
jgi:hypothetical protein